MRILMTVDWRVARLEEDSALLQGPDKVVRGRPYWFYRHWPEPVEVDVLDLSASLLSGVEGRLLRFFVTQPLLAYLKSRRYDLIVSHGARSALTLALLRSLSGERLPPHVVIDVGCFNGGRDNPLELALVRKASRSLAGVISHNSFQGEYYDRHLPWLPHRFIPFGADAEHFTPAGPPGGEYVLSFGSRSRDYPTLLAAWGMVDRGRTRLRIVGWQGRGPGPQAGVDLFPALPLPELVSQIAGARLVVIPLPWLGYSCGQMSFLQSMAMGKACVVTGMPGSRDYLVHGGNALSVPPGDPRALASAIAALLGDEALNLALGEGGRKLVESRFNERNMALEIHDFIRGVL